MTSARLGGRAQPPELPGLHLAGAAMWSCTRSARGLARSLACMRKRPPGSGRRNLGAGAVLCILRVGGTGAGASTRNLDWVDNIQGDINRLKLRVRPKLADARLILIGFGRRWASRACRATRGCALGASRPARHLCGRAGWTCACPARRVRGVRPRRPVWWEDPSASA